MERVHRDPAGGQSRPLAASHVAIRTAPLSWRQRAVKALDGAVDARPAPAPRLRARSSWAWWELAAPVLISALAVARLVWAVAR